LYMLYTGGTTGMPKGVLWRQHDVFIGAMGGIPWGQAEPFESVAAVAEASKNGGAAMMTAAPLMHGAAQWMCFTAFTNGNTVVLPYPADRFDPATLLSTMERERVLTLQIVGDAFARPLVEELAAHDYDLSGFMVLSNGGAAMHPSVKERFFELVPQAMIIDAIGSSETGGQMGSTTTKDNAGTGSFAPGNDTVVVNAAMDAVLSPGSEEVGWLARRGYVPLGYLGDADKTRRTFPEIDGVRYSVPGDRVLWRADGSIEFFGRESATINSGGEKIFAEEVELAVGSHPAVSDVMVVGRPSERWGSEVVAIITVSDPSVTDDAILAEAALHIARYKLPKAIVRRAELKRSPAGKADYRWAKEQAQTPEPEADHPQSTSSTAGDPA
ncbi:MAG: AMP-binding protein, partial [Actinobacteria bacterium]|nr:AMP-binding protein [Actinomycetota bacterium]